MLRYRLTIEVLDDGPTPAGESTMPGQGVLGMSERAAALGGHCVAGVAPRGGWVVPASLPTAARAA